MSTCSGGSEVALLLAQLDATQCALRATEASRWRVSGERMRSLMSQLRPLSAPNKTVSPALLSTGGTVDLDASARQRHDEAAKLARNVDKLKNVCRRITARVHVHAYRNISIWYTI
jgi:hypothetical protein